jgi:alkaline phosphatase D
MASEGGGDSLAAAIEGAAIADALCAWRREAESRPNPRPTFTAFPFTLGVASGSPRPTSVVLWTRLAPEPLGDGGMGQETVPVRWEVAHDEQFAQLVREGVVEAVPARAHSIHVEVGNLEPARWYFFRFIAGAEVSPTGRTRTAPAADSTPERLRFAFASCQNFEHGFYAAHRHAADEDLDLVVFLGDYIYESTSPSPQARRHVGGEARTLAEYRTRHAQYKTDPDLQRLHAAVPWLVTWDDHEVDNNYARDRSETLDPQFLRRRAAAYRAYFEHMPLREVARPSDGRMLLRARYDMGRLARFHVLDGRQHRTPQACPRPGRGGSNVVDARCRELFAKARTMLGANQERWLVNGLTAVPERWNLIAQQTLIARTARIIDGRRRWGTDSWDGYHAARRRLLRALHENRVRSCVVLTGDAHANFACDLKLSFAAAQSPVVATELCGTSISSFGPPQSRLDAIRAANPHIRFADSTRRGYVVVDLTPERCLARFQVIDDATDPNTVVSTQATFTVEAGRPGAQPT